MLSKLFSQIYAADIEDLCTRAVPEDQVLEFKRTLPGDRGRTDPWLDGMGDPTAYAMDRLFREIAAFANYQGGTLILGLVETETKPPRAESINPLPRIHELASRIEDAARDRIDPPIPGLQIRGVDVGDPECGVVVLRTAASSTRPHRLKSNGQVYVRRGTASVPIGMGEIGALVLDRAQGTNRLREVFQKRQNDFFQWLQSTAGEYGGCRITATPLGLFPELPYLAGGPNIFSFRTSFRGSIGGAEVQLNGPPLAGFQPIVRGVRRYQYDAADAQVEVYQNGLIDFWHRHPRSHGFHFHIGCLLGSYLAVIDCIDTARKMAEVPDWEFQIEFALDGLTGAPRFGGGRIPLTELSVGVFAYSFTSKISELPRTLPPARYSAQNERETIINSFFNDLIDASGEQRNHDPLRLNP
jgi:hypothetical protein